MTTLEFRLFIATCTAMMSAMSMLICVMHEIVDPDTVRTPIMVLGVVAITTFIMMRTVMWLGLKKV